MGKCILCNQDRLKELYKPSSSHRDITVYVCDNCGMVQSWPRDGKGDGFARSTGGAGYGNLRTGKLFRARPNLDYLVKRVPSFNPKYILDVGASRGEFLRLANERWPDAKLWGVEPDTTLEPWPGAVWVQQGIEQVDIDRRFDLVYMSHTLEHLRHPVQTLKKILGMVRDGGLLLLEVPNLDWIDNPDVVEEWFLDKHLNHYSIVTMIETMNASGWRVINQELGPSEYTTILASRSLPMSVIRPSNEANRMRRLVGRYVTARKNNHERLQRRVKHLNQIAIQKRTVVWGAGRIFDMLYRIGLNPDLLVGTVDSFAPGVDRPKDIDRPEAVIVCSREYFNEIAGRAEKLWPGVEIIKWN